MMKVHLIKTPEHDLDNFKEVLEILHSVNGPITFTGNSYQFKKEDFYFLDYPLYPNNPFKFDSQNEKIGFNPNLGTPLSWEELFSLCDFYRVNMSIPKDDFVILLTDRRNALNWFSAPDPNNHKNLFIHTEDWNKFTNLDRKFPIAFQVAENLFQVLMGLDFINLPNKYVHNPLVGCINDLCFDKFEVVAKLKSAAICNNCVERIKESFDDFEIAKQLKKILNLVRDAYDIDFFDLVSNPLSPITIKETRRGGIELVFNTYNQIIDLDPQELAIYLFFLDHAGERGLTLGEVKSTANMQILANLYSRIAKIDEIENAYKTIHHSINNSFNQKTSRIKRKMREAIIDPRIFNHYIILRNKLGRYNIGISRALVTIQY